MRKLHLAAVTLAACAAGNARTGTSKASSACDNLPAPTCKNDLPPIKPWDGKPLPDPVTDQATVLVFPDAKDPGSMDAVMLDKGSIVSYVTLPRFEVSKLLLILVSDDPQKTDAAVHAKPAVKVMPGGGPRTPSAEFFRQEAALEPATFAISEERASQCTP